MLLSIQTAKAGVLENKAMKAADDAIAKKVEVFSKSCGKTITVKSDHALAEKMTVDKRTPDNMISVSGNLCAGYVSNLASLCKDADYKTEISKLQSITCTPNPSLTKSPFMTVKKDGTTLTIEHSPIKNGGISAYDAMKAAF